MIGTPGIAGRRVHIFRDGILVIAAAHDDRRAAATRKTGRRCRHGRNTKAGELGRVPGVVRQDRRRGAGAVIVMGAHLLAAATNRRQHRAQAVFVRMHDAAVFVLPAADAGAVRQRILARRIHRLDQHGIDRRQRDDTGADAVIAIDDAGRRHEQITGGFNPGARISQTAEALLRADLQIAEAVDQTAAAVVQAAPVNGHAAAAHDAGAVEVIDLAGTERQQPNAAEAAAVDPAFAGVIDNGGLDAAVDGIDHAAVVQRTAGLDANLCCADLAAVMQMLRLGAEGFAGLQGAAIINIGGLDAEVLGR